MKDSRESCNYPVDKTLLKVALHISSVTKTIKGLPFIAKVNTNAIAKTPQLFPFTLLDSSNCDIWKFSHRSWEVNKCDMFPIFDFGRNQLVLSTIMDFWIQVFWLLTFVKSIMVTIYNYKQFIIETTFYDGVNSLKRVKKRLKKKLSRAAVLLPSLIPISTWFKHGSFFSLLTLERKDHVSGNETCCRKTKFEKKRQNELNKIEGKRWHREGKGKGQRKTLCDSGPIYE